MTNIEKLTIFAQGLLSNFGAGADVPTNDYLLKINESTLEELISIGINYFTNSNIGHLAEINKTIESFDKDIFTSSNPTSITIYYLVTIDTYVNAIIKASNEEIERFETIINNYKKVD